jgi:hypothetical protein
VPGRYLRIIRLFSYRFSRPISKRADTPAVTGTRSADLIAHNRRWRPKSLALSARAVGRKRKKEDKSRELRGARRFGGSEGASKRYQWVAHLNLLGAK